MRIENVKFVFSLICGRNALCNFKLVGNCAVLWVFRGAVFACLYLRLYVFVLVFNLFLVCLESSLSFLFFFSLSCHLYSFLLFIYFCVCVLYSNLRVSWWCVSVSLLTLPWAKWSDEKIFVPQREREIMCVFVYVFYFQIFACVCSVFVFPFLIILTLAKWSDDEILVPQRENGIVLHLQTII